eukprot:Clim_evm161s210 gene=Clim_evmTU161s210
MVYGLWHALVVSAVLAGIGRAQDVNNAPTAEEQTREQIEALPDKTLSALLTDLLDEGKQEDPVPNDGGDGLYDINLLYNPNDSDDWTAVFQPVDINELGRLSDTDVIDECVGRSDITMKVGIFNDSPFIVTPLTKNLWRDLIPVTESIPPNRYKEGCLDISPDFGRELWVFDADGKGYLWNNPIDLKFVQDNEYYVMIKMSEIEQFKPQFKPDFTLPSNSAGSRDQIAHIATVGLAIVVVMSLA